MKKKLLICSIIVLLIFVEKAYSDQVISLDTKEVLIIYSNSEHHPISKSFDNSLDKEISNNITVYKEYMNMDKIINTDSYLRNYRVVFNSKYHQNIDSVIVIGNDAYDFMLNNDFEFLKNSKLIVAGVVGISNADYSKRNNAVYIEEKISIDNNIRFVKNISKNYKKLVIVVDDGKLSENVIEKIKLELYKSELGLEIKFYNSGNINDFIKYLDKSPGACIFYVSSKFTDESGNIIPPEDLFKVLSVKLNKCIYSFWDSYIINGVMGGKVINIDMESKLINEIINTWVLLEENVERYYAVEGEYVFDRASVSDKSISKKFLPEEFNFVAKDKYTLDKNSIILLILVILIILAILILYLVALLAKNKKDKKLVTRLMRFKDTVIDINNMITKVRNIDEIFSMIIINTLSLIPYSQFGMVLVKSSEEELSVAGVEAVYHVDIINDTIDINETYLYKNTMGKLDNTIMIADPSSFHGEIFKMIGRNERQDKIKSLISAPLYRNKNFIGIFTIFTGRKEFTKLDRQVFEYISNKLGIILENRSKYENIISKSRKDKLTKAYSRSFFEEILNGQNKLFEKEYNSYDLAILDINNMKEINDNYGHLAGDELLKRFVIELDGKKNHRDLIVRYGGDEFVIISKADEKKNLYEYLEETNMSLRMNAIEYEGSMFNCDFSYGIASYPRESSDMYELIKLADKRMYEYKKMCKS